VNIALCGLGRIGEVHFQTLVSHPNVRISAYVDVFFDRALAKAKETNSKAYKTLAELMADKSTAVDGVVICTPTASHVENIKIALNAGKQVMCEKPISNSIEEVDECYNLAKSKGLHLLCGFHRRHDPNFSKAKAVLESGKIGKLLKLRSISRDNPLSISIDYLRTSGGIISDCSSHDIDMIRYITGEDPESVYAIGSAFHPEIGAIPDSDQLEMVFKFPSGVIAAIDISRNAAYGYDQRLEVLAHKGSVVVENEKPTTTTIGTVDGFLSEPPCFSFPQRYSDAYRNEMHHFINLVRGTEKVPKLSHKDIHNLTVIIKTAEQSLKEGRPYKINYSSSKL